MSEKIKIYTKTGDDGTTGLVGGTRLKKFNQRLEAYGTIDELNASIGVIVSECYDSDVKISLVKIQNKLFNIGSRLASDEKGDEFTKQLSLKIEDIEFLEYEIDKFEKSLPELKNFILPGGSKSGANCHVARTICRRAERRILEFAEQNKVQPEIIQYVNRLSDFLFVLARKINNDAGFKETSWKH
jgi:cob(I)alamin adenosyltransferase